MSSYTNHHSSFTTQKKWLEIQKRNLTPKVFDLLGSWCLIGRECGEIQITALGVKMKRFPLHCNFLTSHEFFDVFATKIDFISCTFICSSRVFSAKITEIITTIFWRGKNRQFNRVKFPIQSRFFNFDWEPHVKCLAR